jgi:3-hydroxyacyl-CoA dehydrogenase/3a,7a,12a-trihydroxy-5b-cholest-24-enoyl-CoA hydratase
MPMNTAMRFDGRVAVVTGAGHGLGRAHALLLAQRGASVLVNDVDGTAAQGVAAEIASQGGRALSCPDPVQEGHRIVQAALDAFGSIDVVVNNAGSLSDVAFHNMDQAHWADMMDVHLLGSMRVTHAAWPYMRRQRRGRVVMTSSAAGLYGNFGQANYGAAKMGVLGLAHVLAEEGRSRGIHVNTIAPLAVSRMMAQAPWFEALSPAARQRLQPPFVSPLVAWLCHDACTETKGLFEVGGGFFARVRWERAAGWRDEGLAPPSMETLRAHWPQVGDFSVSSHPCSPLDVFDGVLPDLAGMGGQA